MSGIDVEPLSTALGARVTGVDLSSITSDEEAQPLRDLLASHLVLAFPDQDLTLEQHVSLGRHFGDPFIHPYLEAVEGHPAVIEVVKEPDDVATFGGEYWHCDISFRSPPAAASLLYSIEIPPQGGDTLFANQFLALAALSPGLQEVLSTLSAHHVYPGMTESDAGAAAVHPVVRRHPHSGRSSLYVNPAFTRRFDGMTEDESRPLLELLFARQIQPELTARVSWGEGMLLMWDNRATLHYAMNDYFGHRRHLRRVTAMESEDR